MEHVLTTIPVWLVYVLVGAVVMIESFGIPVPGEIVLVTAALMSSKHELAVSPHAVAIAGVAGAVIGDSIGYWVGREYGYKIFDILKRRFPAHFNDDTIAYAEHVFHRYGMLAVFFGRFVALLRIFAGPLSGVLKMHYPRFLTANVAGAICWAGGTTYAVYYLGKAAEKYLSTFSYVALGIAVILAFGAGKFMGQAIDRRVEAYADQRRTEGTHPDVA
ncbi:DedA family protein [Branchiibius cervicis]|uniref:DedA family protein n=1 Tax=Branchiibius cervicis TaxID=908252 RepID=A0ABW2AVD3_9MICO